MDVAAANFLIEEEWEREYEREKRDRAFWIRAFGGQSDDGEETINLAEHEPVYGNR